MRIQLGIRLRAIADLVTPGNSLVDVGCDHGYLSLFLLERGIIPSALATDVNRGPLQSAERNLILLQESLGDSKLLSMETRLSDGLKKILPGEGKSLVIAGMGGELTIHILESNRKTRDSFEELILQPQSEIAEVRDYLCREGFRIIAEDFVKEDGKYYPMMKAVPLAKGVLPVFYSKKELLFGPCLIRSDNPVFVEYLYHEQEIKKQILAHLKEQDPEERINKRIAEISGELGLISECLKEKQEDN